MEPKEFDEILDLARTKGVSDALFISPDIIPVDDKFAAFCREPGCTGYGLSMSCPPHAKGPDWFREQIKTYSRALVFKFDVPTTALLGIERLDLLGLIHETAALLEETAKAKGYKRAKGFAGGSCKEVFCADHPNCRVLHGNGDCRNPDRARQSMSAVGINFLKLSKAVGWKMKIITSGTDPEKKPMGMVAGLVLID
ncbi:MAG: DUF2284 domain-containing protein [Desulfobacter sp.]|nr:MAG: DUF2284 domain-containing protein [Desulfobacter sp.]